MFNVEGWKHIIISLMFKERGETLRPFCILYSVTHLYALCRAGMSYSRSTLLHTLVQQPPSLSFHISVTIRVAKFGSPRWSEWADEWKIEKNILVLHTAVVLLRQHQRNSTLHSWTSKNLCRSGPMPSAPVPTELQNARILTERGKK